MAFEEVGPIKIETDFDAGMVKVSIESVGPFEAVGKNVSVAPRELAGMIEEGAAQVFECEVDEL